MDPAPPVGTQLEDLAVVHDGTAAKNADWYASKGLPGCKGAVDVTHFAVGTCLCACVPVSLLL